MQACLISNSENICALVSEVVGPALLMGDPGSSPPEADLYIWDFDPAAETVVVSRSKPQAKHIYLVARKHLKDFGATIPVDEACIVLKPVNRGILAAFLAAQSEAVTESAPSVDGLREDRDALLEYALQTNLKLQEYDEHRTNFLARALHDLRAPLTALRGYCELLLDGQVGPLSAQQENLLQRMHNSTQRLARLASGMFELSVQGRVERTLQLEEGEIENCLDQAIHELTPLLQEKEIAVDVQMNPPDQPLFIEPHQIEQVFVNLVENSCRFTPKCGEIEIRGYSVSWQPEESDPEEGEQEPNAYRIDVRDSGPGIDASLIGTIFEEYTSYSGGSDRSGGGLGLAICRMTIEAHGGAIWVQSGKDGPLFSFVLPFHPKMAPLVHPGPKSEGLKIASVKVG
jgi:signal transduction histidine kinase